MKIRPILMDSRPAYLGTRGSEGSLLLAPLGEQAVIGHLRNWLGTVTGVTPLVVPPRAAGVDYVESIRRACPAAHVLSNLEAVADAISSFELSDALLVVDPRSLALGPVDLASLVNFFTAEPRVAHHLVSFEPGVAGTKERVSFDAAGQVRKINRHYEPATWSFISGVSATMVPVAAGVLADGAAPESLTALRQVLSARGVPSRDVPITGGAIDLTEPAGMLAANEFFLRSARPARVGGAASLPLLIGDGHSIHPTARISGQVVLHAGVRVEERATILGPVVIGPGATVSAGAIVVQAAVAARSTVPPSTTVRNSVWVDGVDPDANDPRRESFANQLSWAVPESTSEQSALDDRKPQAHAGHFALKRALDFLTAAVALVLLSPVLLLVALAVWIESRGPILYGDEREGLGGRAFRCWKFRTMIVGAHAVQLSLKSIDKMDGPHFKLDRDPRVTRVGRVLRALNLDELPQLLNVLVGEMSLVGPRPSPFRENQICVPWREARLSVRPGITGFWQVCRHNRAAGDFHQWIEYDLLYVQHMSFWLDLKILAATFATLGGKMGHVPAQRLVPSIARTAGPPALSRRTTDAQAVEFSGAANRALPDGSAAVGTQHPSGPAVVASGGYEQERKSA